MKPLYINAFELIASGCNYACIGPITASLNKVEAYNRFSGWLSFGKEGVITENDPDEQEKSLKYLDLVANAVILQNVVDISQALQVLAVEGYSVTREAVATFSPYVTQNLKRYGDFVLDLSNVPQPLIGVMELPIEVSESRP